MKNTAARNRQRVADAAIRPDWHDADLDRDIPLMQSEALTVLCAVVQAGSLGGYASYLDACKAVGLQPLIPQDTRDVLPSYRIRYDGPDGAVVLDAPPVETISDADIGYLQYLASEQAYDLVSQRGGTLQAPAMGTFFARLLSELVLGGTVGDHAYPLLRDKTLVMKDTPPRGKGSGQAGSFTRYVLLSIQYVAWQCAGGVWIDRQGHPRYRDGRFSDRANYVDRPVMLDDGTVANVHGWRHYYQQIEQADSESERLSRYWHSLRELEYLTPDMVRALERAFAYQVRRASGLPTSSGYWRRKRGNK